MGRGNSPLSYMTWLYRIKDGELQAEIFEQSKKKGWYESPQKAEEAAKVKSNDNSADDNQ